MLITETKRLLLREFELSDTEAMLHVFGDPEVMHFGSGVQTKPWVENWLARCQQNYCSEIGYGHWAVVEKQSQQVIGFCGLKLFPDINGKPETEVGYRLARPYWNQGFATEAAFAVRDYGFRVLKLPQLIAIIDPENTASLNVARKLGMQFWEEVLLEGYSYPDHVYAIENSTKD